MCHTTTRQGISLGTLDGFWSLFATLRKSDCIGSQGRGPLSQTDVENHLRKHMAQELEWIDNLLQVHIGNQRATGTVSRREQLPQGYQATTKVALRTHHHPKGISSMNSPRVDQWTLSTPSFYSMSCDLRRYNGPCDLRRYNSSPCSSARRCRCRCGCARNCDD